MFDSSSDSGIVINPNIIFIDERVSNYEDLIAGVEQSEVVVLDRSQNGIEQITAALSQHQNISSLQIISHGEVGKLQLGSTDLSASNIDEYTDQLGQWSQHLSPDGDILLFGCQIGADPELMQSLSDITEADIAASTNLTGYADLNGDWQLETTIGTIESEIGIAAEVLDNYQAVLAIPESNLVVELEFNDSGNTAVDTSPNGNVNNAQLVGGAKIATDAEPFGKVLQLDGINDRATVANSADLNLSNHAQRTVSVWFNAEDINRANPQVIYEEGGQVRGLNIYLDDGQLYVGGWNVNESNWQGTYLSSTAISSDTWHHVALVLDAAPDVRAVQPEVLFAYLDGVEVGRGSGSQLWSRPDGIGLGGLNQSTKFHTGNSQNNNLSLLGKIDEARIYNSALNAAEVAELAELNNINVGDSALDLAAQFELDETGGQQASDRQSNNPGTLVNGASFTPIGADLGGGVQFDGNNDYLAIPNSAKINLSNHAQRTVSVWFNAEDINRANPQVIYEEGGQVRGLNIYLDDGQLYVGGWNVNESNWQGTYLSSTAISSDTWHHVALVLDAAPDVRAVQPEVLFAYLDGVEVGRGSGSQLWSRPDGIGLGGLNQSTKFHTGNSQNNNLSLLGKIDEARIYNSALNAAEVAELAELNNINVGDSALDLAAQFELDETGGQQASDRQSNNPGTLVNGASFTPIGADLGGGVQFDGNNDYLAIPNSAKINLSNHAQRTVSVWFNAEDINRANPQVIYEEGADARGLNIYLDDGQLYVGGWNLNESNWQGTYLSSTAISSDTWHHVALVLDAAPDVRAVQPEVLFAYLDGVEVGRGSGSQLWTHGSGIALGGLNQATRFHTGVTKGTGIRGFAGDIASLEIYNSALNGSAIALLADLNVPDNPNTQTGQFNYGEVLQKNFLFYEANRSGDLNGDNRIEWRSDATLNDGADVNRDLEGGYFDAGDHIKFIQPLSFSTTLLSWGGIDYAEAYQGSGQLDELRETVKWGTDWLLKAHETDSNGDTVRLWVQVGDARDHQFWVPPETIDQVTDRPSFAIDRQNPGADVAASSAAALASASMLFRGVDNAYADELLENAIALYEFAETYQGLYSDSVAAANPFYTSRHYFDELSEGGVWLYRATGNAQYLTKAENYFNDNIQFLGDWTYASDDHSYGAVALLAKESNNPRFKQQLQQYLNTWVQGNFSVNLSPGGFAYRNPWGSAPLALSTSFIAEWYNDNIEANPTYSNFATSQLNYLLGNNPNDYSYVIGFGNNYPLRPHHRGSAGTVPLGTFTITPESFQVNDNILYGALVGGPGDANDSPHNDFRTDFFANEVGISYNAPLAGAAIQQYENFGGQPLSEAQLDLLEGIDANGVGN